MHTVEGDNQDDLALRHPFLDFCNIGGQDRVVHDAVDSLVRRHGVDGGVGVQRTLERL